MLPDFAVGHAVDTAAGHYADIEAHRDLHEHAVEQGLREALEAALASPACSTTTADASTTALDT